MANRHEISIRECIVPELIGVGTGETPEGELRVCISFEGKKINPDLNRDWQDINWTSLSIECAKELFETLKVMKHLWEPKKD